MKLLGIDYGDKYLGLALADSETRLASPFLILDNQSQDSIIEVLKKIIAEEEIAKIIIGRPQGMQGQASGQLDKVDDFIELLKNSFEVEIIAEDERLSTVMAGKLIQEQKRKGERDDAVAAMLILQNYLDRK
ncbi:MAG: Holliday junction resolvase RuvX [bacterium]